MTAAPSRGTSTSPSPAAAWSARRSRWRSRRSGSGSRSSRPWRPAPAEHPSFDERTTALANGTVRVFRSLDVWRHMQREATRDPPHPRLRAGPLRRRAHRRGRAGARGARLRAAEPRDRRGAVGGAAPRARRRDVRTGEGHRHRRWRTIGARSRIEQRRGDRRDRARGWSSPRTARAPSSASRPASRPSTGSTARLRSSPR